MYSTRLIRILQRGNLRALKLRRGNTLKRGEGVRKMPIAELIIVGISIGVGIAIAEVALIVLLGKARWW